MAENNTFREVVANCFFLLQPGNLESQPTQNMLQEYYDIPKILYFNPIFVSALAASYRRINSTKSPASGTSDVS
jgi:hypothetical protein